VIRPETTSDSSNGNSVSEWFALRVRCRAEKVAAAFLQGFGYEWLLPSYKCRRQWSDRIKQLEVPLFPGYLFCKFNPQDRLPVLKAPGLISIVGIANTPIAIEEDEIAALRALVNSGIPRQPWPYLQVGQRVRIEHGALCGVEGILLDFKGVNRVVLSVTLLRRSVAAEIDSAWVIPIHERPPVSSSLRADRPIPRHS
jgi:transcription antitermination factor NusG